MRKLVYAIAAAAWLLPGARVHADEALPQALNLESRLLALEDELAATRAQLAAQQRLLQAGAAQAQGGSGAALDGFFESLEIGGHVTGSYLYNFNEPDSNSFSQVLCQFNCNHNEFSIDAVKLEIGKEAASPGEAGFQIDLLYGQNADIFRALSPDGSASDLATGAGDVALFVQEAYVAYNWNDITLQLGKWETLLGWELIDSHLNYNVSHGILFTWAIPLFHTGALASGQVSEEIGWAVGVANGFNNSIDDNDQKGVLGQLSYGSGSVFTSVQAFVGHETTGGDGDTLRIVDWVLQITPSDDLDSWLNVDWGEVDNAGDDDWWGISGGFNYNLTDRASLALRGEYFEDDGDFRFGFGVRETEAWSATATFGYQLSSNLKARLELRHDDLDTSPSTDPFPDGAGAEDDTDYAIFEMVYVFD